MVVGIALQLVERHGGVDHPYRGLPWRYAVIGRDRIGSSRRAQCCDGCVGGRVQVDQTDIGVGARLTDQRSTPHWAKSVVGTTSSSTAKNKRLRRRCCIIQPPGSSW